MTAFLLDVAYLLALVFASPWLCYKAITSGKYRAGWIQKLLGLAPLRTDDGPCLWFHAVSVGEVLLLRRVVAELSRQRPDVEMVISTTTNTGMEVAVKEFGQHTLFYFPFDFTWAVRRAIARVRPDVVVLAELELWPNFIAAAKRFGARVAVINGRISPRSHRGYRRVRFLFRSLLRRLDTVAVQTPQYADRFIDIGARPDCVTVTGSVKYDGVETDRTNAATARLRDLFRLGPDELVWVAGSTSEPEEQLVLDAYERLRANNPALRLILVPRHKERFDDVARLVQDRGHSVVRRSRLDRSQQNSVLGTRSAVPSTHQPGPQSSIFLVDTIGELSAVWGLADIAFVGGSFAPRGGQNMIEPAGYGAAVVFGPGVWNFQDTVDHLLACGGAVQVATPDELTTTIGRLLGDAAGRAELGAAARRFVQGQHGATARTVELLDRLLPAPAHNVTQAA
jgi:3-deoxy-D-manno-octulosonic-acid transferase